MVVSLDVGPLDNCVCYAQSTPELSVSRAGNELDGEIIAMAPQWISKTAHGRALEEGFKLGSKIVRRCMQIQLLTIP